MTSSCVSVLRIGPFPDDNRCAIQLRSALLGHFAQLQQSSAEVNNLITLNNKYFTAKVILEEVGSTISQGGDGATIDTTNQFAEDGLLLVFDSALSNPNVATALPASFDTMEPIHDRAVSGDAPVGDLLRLCVGVGKNETLSTKEYEDEYSRRVLWCLDRGYEYVEADLSEEGLKSGHDARDKDGFARIVEAVSGTVWSSAVMEKKKQEELKRSYAEDVAAAATTSTSEQNENTNTYEPPDPTNLPPVLGSEEDKERERKAREALLAEETNVTHPAGYGGTSKNDNVDMPPKQRDEIEQERALNALEGSIREAGRIRERSKSGQLSDDERRKRAGDAAMLLMDMMGQMGLESSDDEEETEGKEEQ